MATPQFIGPITLPDGTVAYFSDENLSTVDAGNGNFLVADFGQGGTVNVGNGNSDIFAVFGGDTITTGTGDQVILAGVNSTVTTGGNAGSGSDQTIVSAGKGSTVSVGNGNNIVFMNGTTENVTTGNGTDIVSALGTGSNTVTLGNGYNWTFLHDNNNVINDGAGTDSDWLDGGGANMVTPNAAGGSDFVYGFTGSDTINLSKILAGLNVTLTAASLSPYITLTSSPETNYPGLYDTVLTIKGNGGTATVSLMAYNGGSLQSLINHNNLALPSTTII